MPSGPTEHEKEIINEFLSQYFRSEYVHDASKIESDEESEIESLIERANDLFGNSKGTLGLALDFLIVAEQISQKDTYLSGFDPDLDEESIMERYDQAATKATLTLKYDGESFGIRPVHEKVIDCFHDDLRRTNFPSAAPHHTGEWNRYTDLLERSFRLSRTGRYEASQRLFELGLERLEQKTHITRDTPFPQPFLQVLEEYPRKHADEEAGSAYQAFAYGYVKAEWPHLSLSASKLRTGSSRQNRYGDIDGFVGPDLMVSVEVKDKTINRSNVRSEFDIMIDLAENTETIAIALCKDVQDTAQQILEEADVKIITDDDLRIQLQTWDYHKQNRALQGMIHFFANIEENPEGTQRILRFIKDIDPENTALAHLDEITES